MTKAFDRFLERIDTEQKPKFKRAGSRLQKRAEARDRSRSPNDSVHFKNDSFHVKDGGYSQIAEDHILTENFETTILLDTHEKTENFEEYSRYAEDANENLRKNFEEKQYGLEEKSYCILPEEEMAKGICDMLVRWLLKNRDINLNSLERKKRIRSRNLNQRK